MVLSRVRGTIRRGQEPDRNTAEKTRRSALIELSSIRAEQDVRHRATQCECTIRNQLARLRAPSRGVAQRRARSVSAAQVEVTVDIYAETLSSGPHAR